MPSKASNKSPWSEERLERMFERYNRKYWNGQLPAYGLVISVMTHALGRCDSKRRIIRIDVEAHKSDREIRSTVLHEMAHAAGSLRGSRGHDTKFFAQLEMLLRRKALIGIDEPESGGVLVPANLIPSRFPLLKRKIDKLEARRVRAIEKYTAEHNLPIQSITEEDIIRNFEDVAPELPWKQAVIAVGLEHGLVDEIGRPLTRLSRRILDKAQPRHTSARRDFFQDRKAELERQRLSKSRNPSGAK